VALPWLVLERTGSASSAAFVAAAASIPLLFATIITGTVVDRIGRRTTAILSDALSGLSIVAIPLLDMSIGLSIGWLAVCAALGAVFDPAGVTARETMLPEAAHVSGWRLDRVNSIYEAVYNASYLIGPGLGGLLIAIIGADNTLFVTGAGFALSLTAVAGVKLANAGRPVPVVDPQGFWASTREGLVVVWHDPLLRAMALLSTVVVGLWMPIQGIILPAHYTAANQPGHLGWVLMSISAGGFARRPRLRPLVQPVRTPHLDDRLHGRLRHIHRGDGLLPTHPADAPARLRDGRHLRPGTTDRELCHANPHPGAPARTRHRRDVIVRLRGRSSRLPARWTAD
jgi:MFS family permease